LGDVQVDSSRPEEPVVILGRPSATPPQAIQIDKKKTISTASKNKNEKS